MILVFGKHGQIARALRPLLPQDSLFFGSLEAPFENPQIILNILNMHKPQIVINCSAYTKVDQAQSETEKCFQINSQTPECIAYWCAQNSAVLIHFSTDYVFGNVNEFPNKETSPKKPLNVYGKSKLAGDLAIEKNLKHHLIFRVSWVYDEIGGNFLNTMLRLGLEKDSLRIVSDQVGFPTYSVEIARTLQKILPTLQSGQFHNWGTFHLSGSDFVSWFEFAQEIFKLAKEYEPKLIIKSIQPIQTSEYPTKATRPLNSRLDSSLFKSTFGFSIPSWKASLATCIRSKYANN